MVDVHVTTEGDRGFLYLCFRVNGEPVAQKFELAGSAMRVGGVRWTVKCPESGKNVRDLYLLLGPNHTHFRSRHALKLSYRSSYFDSRYGQRARRLMDRLGVAPADWGEPPIRPKNMQRRTFTRLEAELWDAWQRDVYANLGLSLDRDAFGYFGDEDDMTLLRAADILLRRTRRKSSRAAKARHPGGLHRESHTLAARDQYPKSETG
jgi:hypothetical protein